MEAIQARLALLLPAHAVVQRIDHLTGRRLEAALLPAAAPGSPNPSSAIPGSASPHLLHFAGHGGWDAATATGMLALEAEDGASDPMDAELLATLLRSRGVRLAVLNACGADQGAGEWARLGHALMRSGIPMVVAMAGSIPDRLAGAFASSLYAALATGQPVEVAVTQGRQTLARQGPGVGLPGAWLLPVLFSRAQAGRLVQPQQVAEPAVAPDRPVAGGFTIGTVIAEHFVGQGEMTVIEPGAHVHYGDAVHGDQIQVGDVSGTGVAIGRGASGSVAGGAESGVPAGRAPAWRGLRGLLVRLYQDETSIRRVAGDAGLDLGHIDFHGSAVDQWQSVLAEADRVGALRAVVDIACQQYPRRADELRAAYAARIGL